MTADPVQEAERLRDPLGTLDRKPSDGATKKAHWILGHYSSRHPVQRIALLLDDTASRQEEIDDLKEACRLNSASLLKADQNVDVYEKEIRAQAEEIATLQAQLAKEQEAYADVFATLTATDEDLTAAEAQLREARAQALEEAAAAFKREYGGVYGYFWLIERAASERKEP